MNAARCLELFRSGDFFSSEVESRKLVIANPAEFTPQLLLCLSLTNLGRSAEAVDTGIKALEVVTATDGQMSRLLHAVADAMSALNRLDDSIEYYKKAVSLMPTRPEGLFALSEALYMDNQFVESQNILERLFGLVDLPDDLYSRALYIYSTIVSAVSPDDFFSRFPLVKKRVRHHLFLFGVANMCANHGQAEVAFQCYDAGNKLKRASAPYSLQQELKIFDRHLTYLGGNESPLTFKFPERQPAPIFVIGMPRTGSSLLEQMLGTHSSVTPTGETGWLMRILRECLKADSDTSAFQYGLEKLSDLEFLESVRSRYLELSADFGTDYFIDKTLGNFQLLWLIRAAFPEAIIIHSARERGPTVWSCFKTSFQRGVRFSESIEETAVYFDKVEELCDRWALAMSDKMFRVQYEELIEDPEKMVRKILSRLDLEFQSKTLEPSSQSRIVNTASKVQVTKPIFKEPNREFEPFREIVEARMAHAP